MPKAKGRLPSRDIALSDRFCRRSGTVSESRRIIAVGSELRAEPAVPSHSAISVARALSLPSFQLPGMSTVAGSLKCPWSALFFGRLLFRWFLIIARKSSDTRYFQRFSGVEMAHRVWKCRPENIGSKHVRPLGFGFDEMLDRDNAKDTH
jgi:hypothetical protein